MTSTEGFSLDQLNDVGGGDFTITVGARPDLKRDGGHPSQAGDVLSFQDTGDWQTRPAGADGGFERCRISETGNAVVFRVGIRTVFLPLTNKWAQ